MVNSHKGYHLGGQQVRKHEFFEGVNWDNLINEKPSFVPFIENMEDTRYFKEDIDQWSQDWLDKPDTEAVEVDSYVDFTYTNVNQLKAVTEAVAVSNGAISANNSNALKSSWLDIEDVKPSKSASSTSLSPEKDPIKEMKCLIAEDNPIVLKIANALLKTVGFTSTCVDNGKSALEEAQRTQFDIIFMDIMMPEMDGMESTRRIRDGNGLNKSTAIIAFTAMGSEGTNEKFMQMGFTDCLAKPFTKTDLFAMVRKTLKRE
jgi:CheY-like chemotaxis protein